ncbi:hypothetical protein R6U77_00890 [Lysinibacillus louembei]|uniref:XRE family transcriptional regulator n=1 Tax=Lysinibacillus louembei TaxID=1470088 RepID=A0ABZ0RZG8_9BACI|nr:hypothetical protein [Lysinibacillus louembei]WPK12275.1 hypothetical protein R6U77_00890 [Lysinibacillus louembei]
MQLTTDQQILRAKKRIEILRRIHGLKQCEIFDTLGFTRQYYHKKFVKSTSLSIQSLLGITELFNITEYDLLRATTDEFKEIPIVRDYLRYSSALKAFEQKKLGAWKADIDIVVE